ncbi:hypothetical protein AB0J35_51520 [Nonomuraea angiospora]|uniref:hypothetical protein n=1 Tax=Nonomuraea angiospora TaxID=46172 RepID=UPI00343DEA2E
MRWFLDRGVRPDVAPYFGRTGLHRAIPPGHLEVIRLLLERGAAPSIRRSLPDRRRRLAAHLSRCSPARSRDPAAPRSDRVSIALSYFCGSGLPTAQIAPALPPLDTETGQKVQSAFRKDGPMRTQPGCSTLGA